jgi:fumarate reductase flavoprotein subunit
MQAGASEAALYAKTSVPPKKDQEFTTDVVVVGMGGSGTAAALSAAEHGLKVFAIDKAAKWGGTAAVTSGPMGINVPSQVKAEIPNWQDPISKTVRVKAAGEKLVDGEALFKDWVEYTKVDGIQDSKTEIIKEIMDRSGEVIDWLGGYGFRFTPAVGFVGGKWGIFTSYVGNKALTEDFFAAAYKKFTDGLGGQYLLETEATKLLMKNGKVVGVLAKTREGGRVTIHAKAVILATGGFGGSESLMKKYLGESWRLYGMAQNDGAGVLMATEQGAATKNINMPPMSHFVAPYSIITKFDNPMDNDIPYGMVCSPEVMAVDQSGARFVNEEDIAMNAYKVGAKYFTIFSKEQIDTLRQKGFGVAASGRYLSQGGVKANVPLSNIDQVLEEGIKRGFIYKSDSLKGLVSAINNGRMTEKALLASIEGYGAGAKGKDPFAKSAQRFERLGAPGTGSGYYVAVTGAPYIYSVCAGLDVNAKMQVLKQGGKTLDGLYAVGTDSMGVLFTNKKGYANYGGVAQGYAYTSGKIAGEEIAAALKK